MRNSPSPERRPSPPGPHTTRGWIRGLTIILVIAMVSLLAFGLWALGKNDFGVALAALLSGVGVTVALLVLTLFGMRRPRL